MYHSLPSVAQLVLVVAVCCALTLLPYLLARRCFLSTSDENTHALAGSVIFRVGALHSLILALVFAQELLNFSDVRHTMTREASLVGNVYYDLGRYDEELTLSARADLLEYTKIVINQEWDKLASESRLDERAWEKWKSAYLQILDLEPVTPRQHELKSIMLVQVRELSELRINRESASLTGVNNLFLFAAIGGLIVISFSHFNYAPTRANLTLLMLLGFYTGCIIYFIIAFSDPYSGVAFIEPIRLERLYQAMVQ